MALFAKSLIGGTSEIFFDDVDSIPCSVSIRTVLKDGSSKILSSVLIESSLAEFEQVWPSLYSFY